MMKKIENLEKLEKIVALACIYGSLILTSLALLMVDFVSQKNIALNEIFIAIGITTFACFFGTYLFKEAKSGKDFRNLNIFFITYVVFMCLSLIIWHVSGKQYMFIPITWIVFYILSDFYKLKHVIILLIWLSIYNALLLTDVYPFVTVTTFRNIGIMIC